MSNEHITRIENKGYPIFVGMGILGQIYKLIALGEYSKLAVLTDTNVHSHWSNKLVPGLNQPMIEEIVVPSGEQTKSINEVEKVWLKMLEAGLDRHSLLINLGGGVIGDLGGFAASTFMRGIDFLHVPTSLLAMVDASVGGKTGIDLGNVKNVVGTFQEPIGVVVDVDMLETLPKRELISGFAEVIKHGVISDRSHFALVTSKRPEEFTKEELIKLISDSIKIKLGIVELDPHERGLRKVLNFGHTIGHAIEASSLETNEPLLHGEAIAIGMIAESKLAELTGLLSNDEFSTIEDAIKKTGLPTRAVNIKLENIQRLIISDKKNKSGDILWSLPERIGSVKFDIKTTEKLIVDAIKYILL